MEEVGAVGGRLLSEREAGENGKGRRVGRPRGEEEERMERKGKSRKGRERERGKEKMKCLSEIPILERVGIFIKFFDFDS